MMGSGMLLTGLVSLFAGDFSGMIPEPTGTTALTPTRCATLFAELADGSLAVGIALVVLIETHSLPTLVRCYPCSFTFYVSDPSVSFRFCANWSPTRPRRFPSKQLPSFPSFEERESISIPKSEIRNCNLPDDNRGNVSATRFICTKQEYKLRRNVLAR
jgi:hypothetical protein